MANNIEFTRGDYKVYKFQRRDRATGEVITERPAQIYFTVRETPFSDALFQKKLDAGIEFNDEDNYYYLTITPEDTNGLPFGSYRYDIEVMVSTGVPRTIAKGEFRLFEEETMAEDE